LRVLHTSGLSILAIEEVCRSREWSRTTFVSRGLICAGLCFAMAASASAAIRLSETGSTLLFPILTVWISRYVSTHPDVRIDAAATGSGIGIASAIAGRIHIGGSDAFLTDAQLKTNRIVNVPLAVSEQEVDYNLPELRHEAPLRLSGPTLAGMFDGSIATWDDPKIAALNPGRALPHHVILPIHRTDGAGDTLMFTEYLSLSTPSWDQKNHFGASIQWPQFAKALEATGNAGMIDTSARVPYSVAYVGISYAERARYAGLEMAALQNKSGAFVLPNENVVRATADALAKTVPDDGRLSMIYTSGTDAYPLVNFEYAIVSMVQKKPGVASALRNFLTWVVNPDEGNDATLLATVHFVPLPNRVRDIALRQISAITGP
jgi:phosphate transport system substrate-binding protein